MADPTSPNPDDTPAEPVEPQEALASFAGNPAESEANTLAEADSTRQSLPPLPDDLAADQTEPATQINSFSTIRLTLRFSLMLLSLLIMGITAILWKPPDYLLDYAARTAENILLAQTGLPLRIGSISKFELRLNQQIIEIENVYVYGEKKAKTPFAVLPRIRIKSDLWAFVRQQAHITELDIDSPQIHVIQDARGQINFKPVFPPSEPTPPAQEPFQLPRLKARIHGLLASYQSDNPDFRLKDRVYVPMISADLHQGYHLSAQAFLRSNLAKLTSSTQINLFTGQGTARAQMGSIALQNSAPYLRMVRDLQVKSGDIDAQLTARWNDFNLKGLNYQGFLHLNQVQFKPPFYAANVKMSGKAKLDPKTIQLQFLNLNLEGSTLSAHGWLQDYQKNPHLDLYVQSPGLNIAGILKQVRIKELKEIMAMKPAGTLVSDIRLQGPLNTADQMRYSGFIELPAFELDALKLRSAHADFIYQGDLLQSQIRLPQISWQDLNLNKSELTLNYRLKSNHAKGSLKIQTAQWQDASARGLQCDFDYHVKDNQTRATLKLDQAQYQDSSVQHSHADIQYRDNLAQGQVWIGQGAYQAIDLANGLIDFTFTPQRSEAIIQARSTGYPQAEIQTLDTRVVYTPQTVDVPYLRAEAFSGNLQARARVNLTGSQSLNADLEAQNISMSQVQQSLGMQIPADYRPAGKVNLQARSSGSLSKPIASGRFYVPTMHFPVSKMMAPMYDLQGQFDYSQPLSALNMRTNSEDLGLVNASARLRQLDQLQARIESRHLPLKSLNKWSPQKYIQAGKANFNATLAGSLKGLQRNWMAFDARADIDAHELRLNLPSKPKSITQTLDQANLKMKWHQGLAEVESLVLKNDDSQLFGNGRISVPKILTKGNRSHAITGELNGKVDIADFPFLSDYDVTAGQVRIALKADTLRQGDIIASLDSQADGLRYQNIQLDQLLLKGNFADQLVKIDQARLRQQDQHLDVTGQINLKPHSPSLALVARSDSFDIEKIVALLPGDLRKQFEPEQLSKALPAPDKQPKIYTLPMIEKRTIFRPDNEESNDPFSESHMVLSWKDVYDHWERWKLPPADNLPRPTQTKNKQNLLDTLSGDLSIYADIQGSLARPQIQLQSVIQDLVVQENKIAETALKAKLNEQQELTIDQFYVLQHEGGMFQVKGKVDLNKGTTELDTSGSGLDLEMLKPFLDPNLRLNGLSHFYAFIEGQLKNPKVSGELNINRLLANRYFFDELDARRLDYSNGYVDTRLELRTGEQEVIADGRVPVLNLKKPMEVDLQLENESFGLMNLFTNSVDWRKGKGALLVKVLGSPRSPQLEGTIRLDQTEFYLPSLKESVTGLRVRGELTRRKDEKGILQQNIELKDARGYFGGGKIGATGSMDLLNLMPSYFDLDTFMENVRVNYMQPGLFETYMPIKKSNIKIHGLIDLPILTGEVHIGSGGKIVFPFLRDKPTLISSSSVDSSSSDNEPKILFGGYKGGFKIFAPDPIQLNSPLFDIPIFTESGLDLGTMASQLSITGDIKADKGKFYILNNILNINQLNVDFRRPQSPSEPILNASFLVDSNFNVKGAEEPVQALISGNLEDVKNNTMQFSFSNTQGLSSDQILRQLIGFKAVEDLSQGNISSVAIQFSESVLRGLFDPLTSQISTLLGLEDLSFGIAGQSARGPVFKFSIRSSPFFFMDEVIEKEFQQLDALRKIRLRATGLLDDATSYELGASYRFNEYWALDYKFEQIGSINTVKVNGNYLLDFVLKWADYVRETYFGWQDTDRKPLEAGETPSPQPAAEPTKNE